jgi:hypothetical protein
MASDEGDPEKTYPDFQAMSLDELWSLREQIGSLLVAKAEAGNRELEERLTRLIRQRAPERLASVV